MIRSIFARRPARPLKYQQASAVMSVEHGQKTVLLDPASEQFYALDETAQRIWALIESPRAADEIVASLKREYPTADGELAADVSAFLDEMSQMRLVEVR